MQGNITDWGKEVKKGLIERGWSINDLAERIGKSRTRVSGVVNGRIYSDSIASAISDLLNIEKASASMKEATRDWCMDARKAMIDLDMNTTTGQALLPENDKPVDAFAAIKAQKQAEPVIDGMILEEA